MTFFQLTCQLEALLVVPRLVWGFGEPLVRRTWAQELGLAWPLLLEEVLELLPAWQVGLVLDHHFPTSHHQNSHHPMEGDGEGQSD